jgi:hypothetical protein
LNGFSLVADNVGIDALKFVVGNDEYDAVRAPDKKTFTFKNKDIYIEKSTDIKIVVDVDNAAVLNTTISFTPSSINRTLLSSAGYVGRYDEYNEKIAEANLIGSITLSKLRVDASKGSLTNDITKELEVKVAESVRVVLFDGEYTASKQNVSLNEFIVKYPTGLPRHADDYVTFYLKIDGKEVASADIDKVATTEASDMFGDIIVKNGKTVKVTLEADLYLTKISTTSHQFELTLKGLDDNGNEAGVASDNTRRIKVVKDGSVIITDGDALKANVVKSEVGIDLVSFKIQSAENTTSSTLTSLDFDFESIGGSPIDPTKVEIRIANTPEDADTTILNNYAIDDINYDLSDQGVVVKIRYKGELATDEYQITLNKINGESKSRVYKRMIVDVLVKVEKQTITNDETKFIFKIDKKTSSQTVSDLCLSVDN